MSVVISASWRCSAYSKSSPQVHTQFCWIIKSGKSSDELSFHKLPGERESRIQTTPQSLLRPDLGAGLLIEVGTSP